MRALVAEHTDFVWRSLRRLGVPEADCADGCQRVWLVIARKGTSIPAEKLKSYIFSVLVRIASDMRRHDARRPRADLDAASLSVPADAESEFERRRARALVDEILSGMSWKQRTVFVMFEIEGLSATEIAEALGLPSGTVSSRLRLAREAFDRALDQRQMGNGAGNISGHSEAPPCTGAR